MTRFSQFALPFPYRPSYAGAAFLAAPSNAEALAWLDRSPEWPSLRLALWGEAGCGKTHLLHRWAERAGADWLDGQALRGLLPAPARPLAIDDADAAADEETLLHLLNAACEAGQPVLMTGREPPARWPMRLPDLASRLRAVAAVRIAPPDDDLLRALLARLLADRRLAVPEAVQDWMLVRLPRRAAALREAAERLDRAAWESGLHVTRRLAEASLRPLLAEGDEFSASSAQPGAQTPPLL